MELVDHTLKLATFLANLTHQDLSPEVIDQAEKSILNSLGCGLGYALHPPAEKAFEMIQVGKQCSDATILGRKCRASVEDAILLNGIALTTADFDDTHLRTVVHPSGTSLASLLSFAELNHMTGKEFILAFVCGLEAQCAVANAISPGHYSDGWHVTGTTGTFGSTAAIAKALELTPTQYAAAFGHAASMAGGMRAMFGTDTKTLHMGRGAQNGLLAASLASHGFGSCGRGIESWAKLVSGTITERDLTLLADGSEFQILENSFKPYPCGIVIHPVIDTALEAHKVFLRGRTEGQNGTRATSEFVKGIDAIEVVVNPLCVKLCSIRHPTSGLETIFSLFHGCAVALLYGLAGPAQFSDLGCSDELTSAVRDKIRVKTDASVEVDAASTTVKFATGESRSFHIDHATGSLARPMTAEQLEQKFLNLSSTILGPVQARKVLECCKDLENISDMHDFVQMLAPS